MFRLVLGNYVLNAAAGKDNRLYIRGRDAAGLLGYKSKDFFKNNHCIAMLRDILKETNGISKHRLDENYIEYLTMLQKRRMVANISDEWSKFKELFISVKVTVFQVKPNAQPVVTETEDGPFLFRDWFFYNYITPFYSSRLTSPSPPQLEPQAPPNTPTPSPPPQPIDYSTRDSTSQPATPALAPSPAVESCYILMDTYPPNTIKMCFGGPVYEFIRK